MTDPWDMPEMKEWADHIRKELVPKLVGSAATVSIVPKGETDVKYAVELGMSIMLEKPLVLMVSPGAHVPDKLAQIADAIIEIDFDDADSQHQAGERLQEFLISVANDGS